MPVITILKKKGRAGSSTIAANLAGQFVAEAVLCGQTIDEYEPDGASAKEFAALADAIGNLPL